MSPPSVCTAPILQVSRTHPQKIKSVVPRQERKTLLLMHFEYYGKGSNFAEGIKVGLVGGNKGRGTLYGRKEFVC